MRRPSRMLAAAAITALLAAFAPALATERAAAAVGEAAPVFSLPGTDGETHSLEAQRGRAAVILVFYRGVW